MESWLRTCFPDLLWFHIVQLSNYIVNLHLQSRVYREHPTLFYDEKYIHQNQQFIYPSEVASNKTGLIRNDDIKYQQQLQFIPQQQQ